MKRWSDLEPDPQFVDALDLADTGGPRSAAIAAVRREPKHGWSNRFADACARMVASAISENQAFANSEVLPNSSTKAEPIRSLLGGKSKKIDVVVSARTSGLQVGVSLKGMNFRDRRGLQFDKNLTGRTYELEDEVRFVHRTLPYAFMVGLYFLPIGATEDKQTSSFARTVEHLRSRVGRTDARSITQMDRADMAAVALYSAGDVERYSEADDPNQHFEYQDSLRRGIVRYFDVKEDPPRRGRPTLERTYDLPGLVDRIADSYRVFALGEEIKWSEPEID